MPANIGPNRSAAGTCSQASRAPRAAEHARMASHWRARDRRVEPCGRSGTLIAVRALSKDAGTIECMAALSYREYPPPADLARWIACFWQIDGAVEESSGFSHRVLPDGCADLLFDLQDARRRGGAQGEIVGPMSAVRLFELRAAVDLLGIRLRP